MPSNGFDITTLQDLRPPQCFCKKCYALMRQMPFKWGEDRTSCPVCHVQYVATDEHPIHDVHEYLADNGLIIRHQDLLAHCQRLASIALRARAFLSLPSETRNSYNSLSPMGALLAALQEAQQFIHFTSYGISPMLVGAIKMAAQRVKVRGIVSNVDASMVEELTKCSDEAPKLDVKIFERDSDPRSWATTPHQKLIVIDGLLAFTGGANLTVNGWRKAAEGRVRCTPKSRQLEVQNRLKEQEVCAYDATPWTWAGVR